LVECKLSLLSGQNGIGPTVPAKKMHRRFLAPAIARLRVFPTVFDRSLGKILAGPTTIPCTLGRAGLVVDKREGDGGTPIGRFQIIGGLFRPDRFRRPKSKLPFRPIKKSSGWCDDIASPNYNREVRLPSRPRHERLWRDDPLYDEILILNHNHRPRVLGRGSAIFLHIASKDRRPTEGCIAVSQPDMRRLMLRLSKLVYVEIHR
jgi:L,D-peptidoglycan transpeptidase YkuD (ErfK/YbiS/YcfS/YnhG family)